MVRNISALCYQQKKNEATLEEAIILIGELEQAGQAEARENEKKGSSMIQKWQRCIRLSKESRLSME